MKISIPEESRRQAAEIGLDKGFIDAHTLRAARLVATDERSEIGSSRLGGVPDLPVGTEWPRWDAREHDATAIVELNAIGSGFALKEAARIETAPERPAEPLAFLAQLDLSDLATIDHGLPLPTHGHLYFFADTEIQPWGYDPAHAGAGQILHAPAGSNLSPTQPPNDLADDARFESRAIETCPVLTLPSWDHIDIKNTEDQYEAYADLRVGLTGSTEPTNQVGGHPEQIQGDMRRECELVRQGLSLGSPPDLSQRRLNELAAGAPDWHLALQLGGDDQWMWGDSGCLYWWIREQDIIAGRWDASWLILQCY